MNAKQIDYKRAREKKIVDLMISLYCHGKHGTGNGELCNDCKALTDYANTMVENCPFMATKTFCSKCKIHCYKPQMRDKIRLVMKWSGPRMIFYHPIMAIQHLFAMKKK